MSEVLQRGTFNAFGMPEGWIIEGPAEWSDWQDVPTEVIAATTEE